MKEESQIQDMRAALQGDRERARQRSVENVRALYETSQPEPLAEPERDPEQRPSFLSRLFGR